MSILLVGCGYWGRNWAKTLHKMGELAGICEPNPETQQFLKKQYPDVRLYANLDEALGQRIVEAVVIVTPAMTHAAVAEKCLLAGKHALVEKPLTLDVQEAEAMVRLARAQNKILAVGHLLMYHPGLLTLKALMDAGELGDILSVQCTRINLGKVRNEENVWWSLAPHDLSILSMLLDEPYSLVDAVSMPVLGRHKLPDTVTAWFESQSGRQGCIQVSWLAPGKKHETLVIGTRKIAVFDDAQPAERKLGLLAYSLDREGDTVHGVQRGEMTYIAYETPDELLVTEARAFLAAVRGERDRLPNDGVNGLEVVKLLNEVQTCIDRQRRAVPV